MAGADILNFEKLGAEYARNGAVCIRDCLSEEWIRKIAVGIQSVQKQPSPDVEHVCYRGGHGAHFTDVGNFRRVKELQDFVCKSPIAMVVSKVVGTRITFYYDKVVVRDPHDLDVAPYHMEMSNYPFDGSQGCSVLVAVDKVSLETTPKFVLGSHLWGKNFLPLGFNSEVFPDENSVSRFERVPDIRSMKEAMIMEWNLAPGDVILYNMKTLISSNGNVTDHVQRSLTTNWLGDDIRVVERPWPVFPPITGNLKTGDHPSKDSDTFPVVYPSS